MTTTAKERQPGVSIVVPVYRSATTIAELVRRVRDVFEGGAQAWELILVDDASPDESWSALVAEQKNVPEIRCIQLMRNFGQHNALMCGFKYAKGDVVVTIDDDLQHEPESIPQLLSQLNRENVDIVYGIYGTKKHAAGRNVGSWLVNQFYRVVFRMPVTVTSFRAVRREVIDAILRYELNFTYIDGLLAWNSQRIAMVEVPHHERTDGRSGYTISKLVGLAMNVFTNFSLLPLQAVSLIGFAFAMLGLGLGTWYLLAAVFAKIAVPGYASIIVAVLVLGGLQLLSLGVIGEYIGRLHLNVNRKPQYTVRQIIDRSSLVEHAAMSRHPVQVGK